jgi:hypothetical protein
MYNTEVLLTYHDDKIIFLETDELTEKEKEFVRNVIYRQEFLEIFDLEEFEDNVIISELYPKIKNRKELKECMTQASSQVNSSHEPLGLIILYSYQYMYLTHVCVSEYLTTGKIKEESINKLRKELEIN